MSILIKDLDASIINFMELQALLNLTQINKYYNLIISQKDLIKQWNIMKNIQDTLKEIFIVTCRKGYIAYAKSLVARYKIDIHDEFESAFGFSCLNGDFEIAKWLIDLGNNYGYGKIDIHADLECAFGYSCQYGHNEIAKWLIE